MEENTRNDDIVLYGSHWCSDTFLSVRVLKRQGVPFQWIDIDEDQEGCEFVKSVNRGMKSVPTIVFPDGEILVEPSKAELQEKLKRTLS
jgi:mycoredoxin